LGAGGFHFCFTPSRNWLLVAWPQKRGSDRGTTGNPYS
jgi:hypothetical protein